MYEFWNQEIEGDGSGVPRPYKIAWLVSQHSFDYGFVLEDGLDFGDDFGCNFHIQRFEVFIDLRGFGCARDGTGDQWIVQYPCNGEGSGRCSYFLGEFGDATRRANRADFEARVTYFSVLHGV